MNRIFKDPMLSQRIGLKGFSPKITAHQVFGYLDAPTLGGDDVWTIAEWFSRSLLHEKCGMEPYGNTGYRYFNDCKQVILFPGKNEIRLAAYTSKEYDTPRTGKEPWVHLLMEQRVADSDRVRLENMKHLYLTLEYTVDFCEMKMSPDQYDPNCHAAQISWYFTLEDCDDSNRDFEGRPDYLWFGLPMWDNRDRADMDYKENIMFDAGTNRLIYCMDKNRYIEGGFAEVGRSYRFSLDVLPVMRHAYDIARAHGALLHTDWKNLAIGSTNIGWEVPGTFDCQITLKDMDATYILK